MVTPGPLYGRQLGIEFMWPSLADLRTPGYFVWTSPAMDCFYFQIDNYSQEQNSPGLGDGSGVSVHLQGWMLVCK